MDEINQRKSLNERRIFFLDIWNSEDDVGIALGEDSYGPNCGSCAGYMNKGAVKSYFWKINDSIIPFLNDIFAEEVYSETDLREITRRLLEDLSKKIGGISKLLPSYGKTGTLLNLLESKNNGIIVDLIVEESKASENTYRIYTGEPISQDIYKGRTDNFSSSFSDGMFGGIISDASNAMAFVYALVNNHMKVIDLPKEELLDAKTDSRGVEQSGLAVSIPPVICMGATLGKKEYFHVRTKVKAGTFEEGKIPGVAFDGGIETTPWLVTNSSQVEDFWGRCELVTEKSYNISKSKVLNVKTYRINLEEKK